jgi:predicted DNA-binding antitoxin AbrB/MazE fold protein
MTTTIRARFRGGVLEPLERIDLPEGEEVTVTIASRSPADRDAFLRAAGSWRGKIDAETLIRDVYVDRLSATA